MTKQEIKKLSTQLQPGDRFYYTGDAANVSSFGTITARVEDPKWGLSYNVEYDRERFDGDSRINRGIKPTYFTAHPGQRFKTVEQYRDERKEAAERLKGN